MKKIILITFSIFLATFVFGQNHISDSTVFLKLGNEKIECKKRFFLYNPVIFKEGDTTFYNPPRFFMYLFKDSKPSYIKTFKHSEYLYIEDEYGDVTIENDYESDSTYIGTYFGEISKDSLFSHLSSELLMEDGTNRYPINRNFTVFISRQTAYRQISGTDLFYTSKLSYEIQKTGMGDVVILSGVNFLSKEAKYPCHFRSGYWKIK